MNHNERVKGSPLKTVRTALRSPMDPREISPGLVALGAILALVLLSGCASVASQGGSDPWVLNSDNGRWVQLPPAPVWN